MNRTALPTARTSRSLTNLTPVARQFFITAQVFLDPSELNDYAAVEGTDDTALETVLTELSYHLHTARPWEPITVFLERRDNRRMVRVTFTVGYQVWEGGERVTLRRADEVPF